MGQVNWIWSIATYVWNVDADAFAKLYGRSWEDDPLQFLAKVWEFKEQDPLAWLASLSTSQTLRIQDEIENSAAYATWLEQEAVS